MTPDEIESFHKSIGWNENPCCLQCKEKIAELEDKISKLQSEIGWEYKRQRRTYDECHRSNYNWK